jgi:hypothetical protein
LLCPVCRCSKCRAIKPACDFDRYKRTQDGLHSQCKACMKAARPTVTTPTVEKKACAKCKIVKPSGVRGNLLC